MAYKTIQTKTEGRVGVITFDRPAALNALCDELTSELASALEAFEADEDIGWCRPHRLRRRPFAAGADIKELQDRDFVFALHARPVCKEAGSRWPRFRKPVIAAVAGYALGGGCEIAMMCDFIIAAETAKFGQPEINLGVMPGAGGTQRLPRAVGKAKAMDMCLTGRMMNAEEAERAGLVSRIVPADDLIDTAMEAAEAIAAKSLPIAMMTKEAVNMAYEMGLTEGIRFERRVFQSQFATEDQKEGMAAFASKRAAHFRHR